MTCGEGLILGYMFLNHELENRTNNSCVIADKCVDYVKLTFPNSTDKEMTCGEEVELNTIFADGFSELSVDFYTNREEETAGFSLNVMCYEPSAVPSNRKRAAAEEEADIDRLHDTDSCECLPNTVRNTVDSAELLVG